MPRALHRMLAVIALIGTALAGPGVMAAQTGAIGKPVQVPSTRIPTIPPAVIDDTLEIGGDTIDARQTSTRMTVDVLINGRGPYRFLVDSGADTSVVGLRVARDLQLPLATPVVLHGMTSSAQVERVKVERLQLGPSMIERLTLPVLKESDLGGHGIIGIDALVEQRLMLDFEKRLIRVEDASRPVEQLDGVIVVRARRRRGQLILTQVATNQHKVEAVIDTGSEITIGNLALRDKLIRGNRDKFVTVSIKGVTGVAMDLQVATIAELKLGSVTLRDVPMAFADVPPFKVFGLNEGPALLLGTDLMETFRRISLDFRARKVRFQLKRCGSSGVVINTSPANMPTRLNSGASREVCRR